MALGVTNQRETTVGFDRESGELFQRAIVWQDRRTAPICEELEARGHGPRVRATTGLVLDSYFSATKMSGCSSAAVADDSDHAQLRHRRHVADLETHRRRRRGRLRRREPSNASRTLLLDLATREWSRAMMTLFGVTRSMLADFARRPAPSRCISATSFPNSLGVPITGVFGDQQAALFGQACFAPGMVKATYGTGAFVLANAGDTIARRGRRTGDHGRLGPRRLRPGRTTPSRARPSSRARPCSGCVTRASSKTSTDLEALALSVGDAAGVQFVPGLHGTRFDLLATRRRGAHQRYSVAGSGKRPIARALVEALAYQVRAMTDAFRRGGVELEELRADGGAAAMDLLLQLQATNSRVRVRAAPPSRRPREARPASPGCEVGPWTSLDELEGLWHAAAATSSPARPDVRRRRLRRLARRRRARLDRCSTNARGAMDDSTTRVLRDGLGFGEAPRWHEGRLWYSDFYRHADRSPRRRGTGRTPGARRARPALGARLASRRRPSLRLDDRPARACASRGHDDPLRRHSPHTATSGRTTWSSSPSGVSYVGNFGFDLDAMVRDWGGPPLRRAPTDDQPRGARSRRRTSVQVVPDMAFPTGRS